MGKFLRAHICILAVLILLNLIYKKEAVTNPLHHNKNQQHWCVYFTADLNIPPKKRMQMHSAAISQ